MKAWIELDGWIFTCPESWNTLKYDFAIMYSGQVFLLLTSTPSLQQTFHIYYCSMKSCFIFMTRLALNMHRSVWRHFIFFLSTLQCQRTGLCADGWQCPELRGAWYHLLFFFCLSLRSKLRQLIYLPLPPDLWPNVNLENEIQSWKTTCALISSRTAFCAFLICVLVYTCSFIFSHKPESHIIKYSFF